MRKSVVAFGVMLAMLLTISVSALAQPSASPTAAPDQDGAPSAPPSAPPSAAPSAAPKQAPSASATMALPLQPQPPPVLREARLQLQPLRLRGRTQRPLLLPLLLATVVRPLPPQVPARAQTWSRAPTPVRTTTVPEIPAASSSRS
jgi:hypothetical protein